MFTSRCCGISRHSDAIKTALRKQGRNLQTHLGNTILSFMACRQRPAHRPTPLLESALSPLFPSLLKKHTHSHALLPSKKEKPLLFTFYICYKVIPYLCLTRTHTLFGVFAREKWRPRKRGAAGRLAPVNAAHKVGRYLYPQKPYLLLPSEGIFITGAGRIRFPAVLRRSAPAWHGGSKTPRRRNIWPRWGIPLHRPGT